MNPFRFVRMTRDLGVGTRDLGLVQTAAVPINSLYGPRYNVQRSIRTNAPGEVKLAQSIPSISLRGDGVNLQAQFIMQQLAELQGK